MTRRSKSTPEPTSTRLLAYVRVSTQQQVDDGFSLAGQKAELQKWAAYQNLPLDENLIFEDAGISGRHNLRPGLEAMLSTLKPGDTVATYALSRLARGGAMQTLALVERIHDAGARIVFLKEQIDTTSPYGRIMLVVLSEIALLEIEQMRERSEMGRLQAANEGRIPLGSSSRPYGLEIDDDGYPVWDEERARTIRRLFDLRNQKLSLRAVAKALEEEGHPTRRGKKASWESGVVHLILRNPVYKGELIYRQDRERIVIPVPPLVSPEDWQRAQGGYAGQRSHVNPEKFPLTGHLVCTCGSALVGQFAPRAKAHYTPHLYYACLPEVRHTEHCPTNGKRRRLWRTDELERAYVEALAALLENPHDPLRIQAAFGAPLPEDPHVQERQDVNAMLEELLDLRLKGQVTRAAYERQFEILSDRLKRLNAPAPLSYNFV